MSLKEGALLGSSFLDRITFSIFRPNALLGLMGYDTILDNMMFHFKTN